MPFFYQQNINETRHLAIWSITEPVSFFETDVKLAVDIQNEERKLQHLAVRLLFKLMMPEADLNMMVMADNGKPYLQGVPFHFSFSHCKGYAAVAVSDTDPIGIDIEIIHPRILKVANKFLNETEKGLIADLSASDQLKQMAFFWAAKEAMYKQYEQLGIDFAKDFNVLSLTNGERGVVSAEISHKGIVKQVHLDYHFGEDYVCVTCFTESK
jgi:phosphopantetheine--protein transferase-like protein